MGGANPVVAVTLLTLVTLMLTAFNWYHCNPHKVPIWWDLHGYPWIYGPRWFGLLFLPFLTFFVPYSLYHAIVYNNLESHGADSKQSVINIVLMPALFLFTVQTYVIIPADTDPDNIFPARLFMADVALWVLLWFGHNIKHVERNSVIGIVNPWTTDSSWDKLHSQAGLIFEISGLLLFIAAFVVPIGWPLLVVLLVLWLGPWLVSYVLAYTYSSDSRNEPLLN